MPYDAKPIDPALIAQAQQALSGGYPLAPTIAQPTQAVPTTAFQPAPIPIPERQYNFDDGGPLPGGTAGSLPAPQFMNPAAGVDPSGFQYLPSSQPGGIAVDQSSQVSNPQSIPEVQVEGTVPTQASPPVAPQQPSSAQPSPSTSGTQPSAPGAAGGGKVAKLTKDAESAYQGVLGAFDKQQAAVQNLSDAEKTKVLAIGDMQGALARRQQEEVAIQNAENRQILAKHDAYLAKSQQIADDLANSKVDPNRLFANADSAQKFSFMLGGILGGVMQGLGKTSGNSFIESLNGMIDRDIRIQSANIENKRAGLQARNSVYGEMRAAFGDKRAADQAYMNGILTAAETELKAQAAQYDSPIIQARAQQAIEAIGQQKAQLQSAHSEHLLETAKREVAAQAAAARALADRQFEQRYKAAQLALEERKVDIEGKKVESAEGKELRQRFVPTGPNGQGYLAATTEEATKLRDSRAEAQKMLGTIDQLLALRKNTSFMERAARGLYTSDDIGKIKAAAGDLVVSFAKSHHLGTWDNGTATLVSDITGNPAAVFGTSEAQLQQLRQLTLKALAADALSQGQNQQGQPSGIEASSIPSSFVPRTR